MDKSKISKWQRELQSFLGIKSTFIIEGNINDLYPIHTKNDIELPTLFGELDKVLEYMFNSNIEKPDYDFLFCNQATGFYNPISASQLEKTIEKLMKENTALVKESDCLFGNVYKASDIETLSEFIRNSLVSSKNSIPKEETRPLVVVVNFASRYLSAPNDLNENERKMFLNLMYASINAKKVNKKLNTLILVVEKFNDLPSWFYYNNPKVRTITIPHPDKIIRSWFIENNFEEFGIQPEMLKRKEKFIDLTDGLNILELRQIQSLYKKEELNISNIEEAVSIYKYGIRENMWNIINREKIKKAAAEIKENVIGQDQAVDKTINIIKRAVSGMSGLQHSSGDIKPKGVLFFAGPTGTGKTELSKRIAELLFGDEKNCIRFDMSEYSAQHADQKLFGAPPGYVGYEAGGQLTNAIKAKPFSILLFDEIEKAHPSIMDKFLQILEDGRMTDGQGNTVYFSEAIIIFTSNLGISKEVFDQYGNKSRISVVKPEESFEIIQNKITIAIQEHFKPEVLNRIGNNIIMFDFIRNESVEKIVKKQIRNINNRIFKNSKINVISDQAYDYYFKLAKENNVLEMGGRGIGNMIEEKYINPLAEYIFDNNLEENSSVYIEFKQNKIGFRS